MQIYPLSFCEVRVLETKNLDKADLTKKENAMRRPRKTEEVKEIEKPKEIPKEEPKKEKRKEKKTVEKEDKPKKKTSKKTKEK